MGINTDWTSLGQVIRICKFVNAKTRDGVPRSIIVKHEGQRNYNIVKADRTDLYDEDEVVFDPIKKRGRDG